MNKSFVVVGLSSRVYPLAWVFMEIILSYLGTFWSVFLWSTPIWDWSLVRLHQLCISFCSLKLDLANSLAIFFLKQGEKTMAFSIFTFPPFQSSLSANWLLSPTTTRGPNEKTAPLTKFEKAQMLEFQICPLRT